MENIQSFESFINESKELTSADYKHYFPILGKGSDGLEFNFNGQSVGGYVVPKKGEDLDKIIAQIEKMSKGKLTAVPYDQERHTQVSGTKAGFVSAGKATWLQILKK